MFWDYGDEEGRQCLGHKTTKFESSDIDDESNLKLRLSAVSTTNQERCYFKNVVVASRGQCVGNPTLTPAPVPTPTCGPPPLYMTDAGDASTNSFFFLWITGPAPDKNWLTDDFDD